jgi:hypothetical protein
MPPRDGENAGGSAPVAASRGKADQDSSPEAAELKTDVDVDCRFQDQPDDDDVIRNLNKMGRMKLCRLELIDEMKAENRDFIAICIRFDEQFFKDQEERNAAAAAAESSS